MRKQSFVLSAIILTLGGFFAKAIGAIYKIPLTNILGSSGMGVYYLIFPIYSLVIAFCSSGISVALSTEVAKCRKIHHRYNEQKLLRVSLIFTFIISVVISIIIVLLSSLLAEMQGNMNAKAGYIAIAPAIILSSLIATVRGYFQGIENMVPTTVSMVIEQIVKLTIGLILAHKLCIYGIEYAVLGAILGVTISEVIALIIIVINFLSYKGQLDYNYRNKFYKNKSKINVSGVIKETRHNLKKCNMSSNRTLSKIYICNSKNIRYSTKVAIKKLMSVALPCTFSSILIPISTMLDSFMIINLLVSSGYSLVISTSLYGIWGGIIQALISLPTIIVSAISTAIVPALSGLVVRNDTNEIRNKIAFYIKLTLVLSLAMFIIFYVFAEDMLKFLYGDALRTDIIDEFYYATKMLKISSLTIIYYAFLQTFTAILQTIGKSHVPFFAMLVSLLIRTGLLYALVSITSINIFGVVIANILFLGISDIILAVCIVKKVNIEYNFYLHLLKPIIIAVLIMLAIEFAKFAFENTLNYLVMAVILGAFALMIYGFFVYFGKVFTPKELEQFKFKRKKISK